ncbi:sensor domain-containing diguanylate cyclase [Malikia sp.]|uniref:sensor domain-containing diguanylate cyclase n=1 Tax=Malikia sp. TaxID=2070706 RepID=UPI002604223F|nr:sensor domain-containing diguanylate cyclase [Malikia sp.]MDD2729065.1 diguanylate cyclase [Malikia sp.]
MKPAQERDRGKLDDERFRLLFLQLPQPVLFVDPVGTIREFNRAAQSLFGLDAPAGRPRTVHQLLTGDGAESLADLLTAAASLPAGQVQTAPMHSTTSPARACTGQAFTLPGSGNGQRQIVLQLLDQNSDAALQHSEARFRLAQEATETGMWDWQLTEDRIEWDAMCWRLLGMSGQERGLDYASWQTMVHPDDLAEIERTYVEQIERSGRFVTVGRYRKADGGWVWIQALGQVMERDECCLPSRMAGTLTDISERKLLEQELQERHQRLDNIVWGTGAGTWEWNAQSGETRLNEAWAGMLGYSLAEIEPVSFETWVNFSHPEDHLRAMAQLQGHLGGETDRYECELRLRHRDGHWVWVLDRGRICTWTEQGEPEWVMGIHLDISQRKAAEAKLERLAHYDSLTGLARRPLLNAHIRQAMSQARRHDSQLALLFLDLDGFKPVNDAHGHAAGDRLLTELAQRMKSCLREIDTVARIGGDEFAALVVDLPERAAVLPLVRHLLETLVLPIRHGALSMQVSASIGLAFYPQAQDAGPDELMQQADAAMYQAKRSGKNRYHIAGTDTPL